MLPPFALRRELAGRIRGSYTWVRRGEWRSAFSRPVATWRAASRLSPCPIAVLGLPYCGCSLAVARIWAGFLVARGVLFGKSTLRGGTFPHSLCVRILLYYSTLLIISILYVALGTSIGIYGLAARNVVPSRRVWRGREAGRGSGAFTGVLEPAMIALGCLNLRILRLWI